MALAVLELSQDQAVLELREITCFRQGLNVLKPSHQFHIF